MSNQKNYAQLQKEIQNSIAVQGQQAAKQNKAECTAAFDASNGICVLPGNDAYSLEWLLAFK